MSSIFGNWFGGNKDGNPEPKEGVEGEGPVSSGIEPALPLTSVKSQAPTGLGAPAACSGHSPT